jgi:hypothetical protein
MSQVIEPQTDETVDCELCIVGAGYAALNGLNAASKYLKKGERVVVLDKNDTWGGQWVHQYDFVRLHQPYRMFTAGDQPWTLDRDPAHLATRREILDHLASVPVVSGGHLEIKPFFGYVYRGHHVRDGRVQIEAAPVSNGQNAPRTVRIRARRLLKAPGARIEMLPPFPLSSSRVRSVGVSDPVLMTSEFLDSDAPVYVIGSGKTAMDCVRHIVQDSRSQRRPVGILIGSGMWFLVRNRLCPTGPERFMRGTLAGDCFLRICEIFDGDNEVQVMRALEREGLAINVFGQAGNCRYGMLSLAERDEVLANAGEIFHGHLVDVEGTHMIVREGNAQRAVSIAEGSWFINCTSHLRGGPHEPVLQDSGAVCAPQHAIGFTGASAYYLTHLWYRNELAAVAPELYRLDLAVEPKLRFAPQMALMVMANMTMANARLPMSIAAKFQGDNNRWFPPHRRALMMARVIASQRQILRKAARVLKLRFSDSSDAA